MLLILALAAFLRVVNLESAPVGGDGNAAWIGINALDWLDHGVRPFYVRELYSPEFVAVYAVGMLVKLTGEVSFLPSRLMTALSGILLVAILFPTTWWLLADASREFRRPASLLASFSAAVSLHAIGLSRLGLESPPFMMVVALLIWFAAWAWQRGGWVPWALAGAALALAQYVYFPARLLPLVLVLWIAHGAWTDPDRMNRSSRGWVILVAVALILSMPALVLFLGTPQAVTARGDAGALTSGGWIWSRNTSAQGGLAALLLKKIGVALEGFGITWDGPYATVHQPMLAPLFFIGFLVAVGALVRWPRRVAYAWPFLAIPVMLIPDLLTGAAAESNGLHQIGVLPFAFILSGMGLALLWEALERQVPTRAGRRALAGVLVAAAILPTLLGLYRYLEDYIPHRYADPETGWRAEQIDVDLSRRLIAEPQRAYLVPYGEYSRSNVAWLLSDAFRDRHSAIDANGILRVPPLPDELTVLIAADPYRARNDARPSVFDRRLWVLLVDGQALLLPPLTADQEQELDGFLRTARTEAIIDRSHSTIGTLYTGATPLDWFAPRQVIDFPLDADFNAGEIRLRGYTLPDPDLTPGALTTITLFWQAVDRPPQEDYDIFVQVWNDAGQSLAGAHDFPYDGMYRSRLWRPGEIVATHHYIRMPEDLAVGRFTLAAGLFRILQNQRVPVTGADADPEQRVVRAPDLRYPAPMLSAPDTGPPPPEPLQFGDFFKVAGLEVTLDGAPQAIGDQWTAQPGQTLAVDITWEALARPPLDYSIFLHLSAASEAPPVAQADRVMGGTFPTGAWRTGDRLADQVTLALPADLPAGTYTVWIGVYYWQTGERLAALWNGTTQPENRVRLGTVIIP
jgi:hypothetical protein